MGSPSLSWRCCSRRRQYICGGRASREPRSYGTRATATARGFELFQISRLRGAYSATAVLQSWNFVALIEIAYQVNTISDENRFAELLLTAAVHLACGLDSGRYFPGDIADCYTAHRCRSVRQSVRSFVASEVKRASITEPDLCTEPCR